MNLSDWTPNGRSPTFNAAKKNPGLVDLGGRIYSIDIDGVRHEMFEEDGSYWVDDNYIDSDGNVVVHSSLVFGDAVQQESGPWLYGREHGWRNDHALAFNKETRMLYEIHYAPEGSDEKSYGYAYDFNKSADVTRFWNSHGKRNKIQLYSVNIPNPDLTQKFFDEHTNKSWNYDLVDCNCKHYVMQAFEAGGALLPAQTPFPSSWPYGTSVGWLLPGTSEIQQVKQWKHKW